MSTYKDLSLDATATVIIKKFNEVKETLYVSKKCLFI